MAGSWQEAGRKLAPSPPYPMVAMVTTAQYRLYKYRWGLPAESVVVSVGTRSLAYTQVLESKWFHEAA